MGLRKDFELFCSGTSLRGVARTVKAPTRPLRCIWTLYVAAMAAFLITCVCFIVTDYLSYKTVIQTTLVLNDPSVSWPSVTVCGHYPFSESGRQLWRTGRVLTPTNFSRMLRDHALKMFDAGDHLGAEEIMASDTKRIYYQNLEPDDAEKLSHTVQQLFIFCINATGSFMEMSSGDGCAMQLKLISLPDYFNCFQSRICSTKMPTIYNIHRHRPMSFASLALVIVLLTVTCCNAQDSMSVKESDVSKRVMAEMTSSNDRTALKAVELCAETDSSMTCAWLLMESGLDNRVSKVACMNENQRRCAHRRQDCWNCDSCTSNFTSRGNRDRVKCYCWCGNLVDQFYECDDVCDGDGQCLGNADEADCLLDNNVGGTLAYLFAASWDLIGSVIFFAVWLGAGGIVVLIYYRMRARGRCGPIGGGTEEQQQQQVLIYQPQQPQQPLMMEQKGPVVA